MIFLTSLSTQIIAPNFSEFFQTSQFFSPKTTDLSKHLRFQCKEAASWNLANTTDFEWMIWVERGVIVQTYFCGEVEFKIWLKLNNNIARIANAVQCHS